MITGFTCVVQWQFIFFCIKSKMLMFGFAIGFIWMASVLSVFKNINMQNVELSMIVLGGIIITFFSYINTSICSL